MTQAMETSIYGAPAMYLALHWALRLDVRFNLQNNPVREAVLFPFCSGRLRNLSKAIYLATVVRTPIQECLTPEL